MNLYAKRGDTLSLACVDDTGDITGVTIEASVSMVRTDIRGYFEESLTVTETDLSAGEYTLSATAAETEDWPIGRLNCDIKYSVGGQVERSETFYINLLERVTP